MLLPRVRAAFRSALFFLAAVSIGACAKGAPVNEGTVAVPGGANPLRLAMVTDAAGLGDGSLNDGAYAGLLAAKRRLGAEIQVLQSKSSADYQANLTTLAAQDRDEIFAVGYTMSSYLRYVAINYPKRHFAIVDASIDEPNVTSLTFREQDGAFLAGALAAMVTKTKTIGMLGGDDPHQRRYEVGFAAGAREVDPRVNVLAKSLGLMDDAASAKSRAAALYDAGADVVFVAAGKAGAGAFEETRRRPHVFAIAADADRDGVAPGKILTSVVKRVDVAVFRVSQDAQSQKLPAGAVESGLQDGGIALTDFKYTKGAIGPRAIARLGVLRQAVVDGALVVPKTREELAAFKPVKV